MPGPISVSVTTYRATVARLRDGRAALRLPPDGGAIAILRHPMAIRVETKVDPFVEGLLTAPSVVGCDCTVADLITVFGDPDFEDEALSDGTAARLGIISGALYNYELTSRAMMIVGWFAETGRRVRIDVIDCDAIPYAVESREDVAHTALRLRSEERVCLVAAWEGGAEHMADPEIRAREVKVEDFAVQAALARAEIAARDGVPDDAS